MGIIIDEEYIALNRLDTKVKYSKKFTKLDYTDKECQLELVKFFLVFLDGILKQIVNSRSLEEQQEKKIRTQEQKYFP